MKIFKIIAIAAALALTVVSCVEKEPNYGNFPTKDVDFTVNVDGEEYTLDFYVVSTMRFVNTSSKSGAPTWDFGDGTTSTEASPLHKYDKAGLYKVTLTVAGVGSVTYPLLVMDIAPTLSVAEQTAPTIVINDVEVTLDIALPNPENLKCKYVWDFPEGTMLADGTPISTFEGYSHEDGTIDNPGAVKFKNIGSQRIELHTWFDVNGENRQLEDSYVNVQVGSSTPAPTIYYAVQGGNIKAYKLIEPDKLPAGTKNLPFDMGVSSGQMPTTLVFKTVKSADAEGGTHEEDFIYILDCGKQYIYVNDVDGVLGDGKITVMSADGTYANVMVSNVGGPAFNDPFQGCADDNYLYYTDRNTGVRRIELTARGEKETTNYNSTAGYYVVNNMLNYYGQGIAYGAIHTGLYLDRNGVFWWGKDYSGNGIYRFRPGDIGEASATKTGPIPFPILVYGAQPRAFTLDEDNKILYVWNKKGGTPGPGFVAYNISDAEDFSHHIKFIEMEADPINTTESEGVYTTQMAVDYATHYVYFGFRAATTEKNYTSGLMRYNPDTGKVEKFCDNNEKIFGLCINPRETNLF